MRLLCFVFCVSLKRCVPVKKFLQPLRNIWSIEDLKSKIVVTLSLIFVYRVGTYSRIAGYPIPEQLSGAQRRYMNGALGLIDAFSGGAFSQASILALGIMPYISASIFMQLMTILIPQMQKVQKEGASGQKKINQWTRYLTVIVTFVQAYAYVTYLKTLGKDAIIDSFSSFFWLTTPIVLTAGTALCYVAG